jgi:hypothetical protein
LLFEGTEPVTERMFYEIGDDGSIIDVFVALPFNPRIDCVARLFSLLMSPSRSAFTT